MSAIPQLTAGGEVGDADTLALRKAGLLLVGGQLRARRRSFRLGPGVEIDAEVRSPPWRKALAALVLSAGGLPVALLADSRTHRDLSWLVLVPMCGLFAGLIALMSMNDRYAVILRSAVGEHCVFSSGDHQLVLYLVAALREAARGLP